MIIEATADKITEIKKPPNNSFFSFTIKYQEAKLQIADKNKISTKMVIGSD